MKKLLVLSIIALFMLGAVEVSFAVNPSGPGASGDIMGMGTGRYVSDPHRTFRLVRARAATTITADSMVVWDTDVVYPTASDGVTVTVTSTSGDSRVAGFLVTSIASRDTTGGGYTATEDVGLRNWGWLQTYGKSVDKATASTTPVTAGNAISCGPTGGSYSGYFGSTTSASTQGNAGFALETVAAGATGYIFLMCE